MWGHWGARAPVVLSSWVRSRERKLTEQGQSLDHRSIDRSLQRHASASTERTSRRESVSLVIIFLSGVQVYGRGLGLLACGWYDVDGGSIEPRSLLFAPPLAPPFLMIGGHSVPRLVKMEVRISGTGDRRVRKSIFFHHSHRPRAVRRSTGFQIRWNWHQQPTRVFSLCRRASGAWPYDN